MKTVVLAEGGGAGPVPADAQLLAENATATQAALVLRYFVLDNLWPLNAAAAIILLISLAGWRFGFAVNYGAYSSAMLMITPSFLLLLLAICMAATLWRDRPDQPTRFILSRLRNEWQIAERICRGLPLLVVLPIFFSVFSSYKGALSHVVPFYFDPYAKRIDQVLLGGDAWKVYAKVIAYPFMTSALNAVYKLWFFVMFGLLTFCIFVESDLRARSRYLLAFLLCWFLIGVVAATALSSAGPCYYQHFFGDPSFDYITQYLKGVAAHYPVPALYTQQYLLDAYVSGAPEVGEGISAAPSMHVSVAVLTALYLARYGRTAAVLGWTYCALILVASVHLGWHYAVDGYLAVILTVAVWMASAKLVDYQPPGHQTSPDGRAAL